MLMDLIPELNTHAIFIDPWVEYLDSSWIIVLMSFFVIASCGLIGNFVILRRMALMGDAISHSLLPGLVIAFLLAASHNTLALFIGAMVSGILTVYLIEYIHRHSCLKPDAAMGIVFSSLFALGVVMITLFADHVDLDTDCVLYGEITFIPLQEHVFLAGMSLGPYTLVRMGIILLLILLALFSFYKELLVSTFDPGLARCLGIQPRYFLYGLTTVLSLVIVSAFKAVGAILVVAMLLFPGATAMLITSNLKKIILFTLLLSALYSIMGFHLATWLDCSIAGAISVFAATFIFCIWACKNILARLKH